MVKAKSTADILRTACEEAIEQFKPQGETTYCNMALNYIAEKMGYQGFRGLLANEIVAKLQDDPDFAPISAEQVSKLARAGNFIVAGAFGQPHGHVSTAYPCDRPIAISAKWGGLAAPWLANIGKETYHGIVTANWAFKDKPRYWVWIPDPKPETA